MKCGRAKRLFGAYWDDETSQAEREWLESHLASCTGCRVEYEALARTLELTATLPRAEPAPDLLERVMARARRTTAAPDQLPRSEFQWIPATAAAALLLIVTMMASPWVGLGPDVRTISRNVPAPSVVQQPRLFETVEPSAPFADQALPDEGRTTTDSDVVAAIPDSLFDHSEDIEFILDPVTMRRGRASMTRFPSGVQGEQAVITF